MNMKKPTICANLKPYHPLTEIPVKQQPTFDDLCLDTAESKPAVESDVAQQQFHPLLKGVSAFLIKLLWDIFTYPYHMASVRIDRSRISGRVYEQIKHEGVEKGYFIESTAGKARFLIPKPKLFEAFNAPNPFQGGSLLEHSFYANCWCSILGQDPRNASAQTEVKLGDKSGATSDIVVTAIDGTVCAYEVTLNTTNLLSNATKYENTAYSRVVFLTRTYALKQAVKACFRESGLNPHLLERIELMHFSQVLQRQRKWSQY